MTLNQKAIRQVLHKLFGEGNYRTEIVAQINAQFLRDAIGFFKKVVSAKIEGQKINPDSDWYRAMLDAPGASKESIATESGLNIKTIHNIHGTARKEIVIAASMEHYDILLANINALIGETQQENGNGLSITLKIEFNGVSVDLTLTETLLVVNALAVKRAALRGGMWSTVGKRVEKPLMVSLCTLFGVSESNYRIVSKSQDQTASFEREIDFYLVGDKEHKCEVKLMGKGNPESADAVVARDSSVFVADKLSETNKRQLDSLSICWVQLDESNGFMRFGKTLRDLKIPHTPLAQIPSSKLISKAIEKSLL